MRLGLRRPLTRNYPSEGDFYRRLVARILSTDNADKDVPSPSFRLSKLLAQHSENLNMSRREAERLIRSGEVTLAGSIITSPMILLQEDDIANGALKVGGKSVVLRTKVSENSRPRVWVVHKLNGEIVTEDDPLNRPSLIQRLIKGGVGKSSRGRRNVHLKPVGRLDMSTEGLLLVTDDGQYSRELELPSNKIHRTYRVRAHGFLNEHKLARLHRGLTIDGTFYSGMDVEVEEPKRRKMAESSNKWLKVTCTQGKNRQIRKVLNHLGCKLLKFQYTENPFAFLLTPNSKSESSHSGIIRRL